MVWLFVLVMKTMQIIIVFAFLCSQAFAQSSDFNLKYLLKLKSQKELQESVASYTAGRNDAEALFLKGMTAEDAQRAVAHYSKLINEFPTTRWADLALYNIGLYYFARGLYVTAREHFLNLIQGYPKSPLLANARYFAAASLCASKQTDACTTELQRFVAEFPRAGLAELARLDLGNVDATPKSKIDQVSSANGNGESLYTLQVGAFTGANNALNLRKEFTSLGYPTEIRKKDIGRQTVYLVLVGTFRNQEAARKFGDELKHKHGKPYRVVSK